MKNKHEIKKTINHVIREKGRFPTLQEMCNKLNFSEEQTKKCMGSLREDGYLESIGNWYKFPDDTVKPLLDNLKGDETITTKKKELIVHNGPGIDKINSIIDDTIDKAKFDGIITDEDYKYNQLKAKVQSLEKPLFIQSPKKKWFKKFKLPKIPKKKKVKFKAKNKIKKKLGKSNSQIYGMPVYIIQFLMGIIGSGAAVISVYYTTVWLFEFLPWAFALLLSTIMVGFAIAAFETIILFMSGQVTNSRIAKIIISIGFSVLFVIVSAFSIMSTVAGQYNKYVANLRVEVSSGDSSDNATYNLLKEEKTDLRIRLSEYRQQVNNLTKILSGMSDVDTLSEKSKIWRNTQYRLYLANKNMKRIGRKLDNIRKKEKLLITKGKKSKSILVGVNTKKSIPDFYGWLSGMFKVGRDKIQFIMSLFPAIFVDVISPVGVGLALFLRNKYKR